MSIKVMTKVWDQSKQKGSALLLLLAISDHAADDGYCWPGIKTLASKIRMSERSVMRLVKSMEEDDELYVVRGNANNRYVVTVGMTKDDLHRILQARGQPIPCDNLSPDKMTRDNGDGAGDTCVTSEVTQPCHPNLHDPSLNHQDRASARPTTNEPKATTLPVFEWEMSDDDIHVIECPQCEGQVDVWTELSASAAQCPHCGLPLQIKDSHGKVTHRPPQAARHRTRASPWLVAVEAFCEHAGLEWTKVSGVQKGQWARSIAEVAGEGADPGEVAAAIRAMEIYDVANLKSPYQARFKEPLVIALARSEGSDLETVPLEELRARLAGGELRMDDLDAGEQAVVLARLGALP